MLILCQAIMFARMAGDKMAETFKDENGTEYSKFIRNNKLFVRKLVRNTTHGMSNTRIYNEWKGMRRRCSNPNTPKYKFYGGKGIKVCPEWDKSGDGFNSFYNWALSNGYQDDLTIDRIDENKDYCPENCRWITKEENIKRAVNKPHIPDYQYFAYNLEDNIIVIFYKVRDFQKYSNIDHRRISDAINKNRSYKNWIFKRIPFNEANIIEGQETIPFGSTMGDELPLEVRIIHL